MSPFGELQSLAERLGLDVFQMEPDEMSGPSFAERVITVDYQDAEQLAHELGHFLVAPLNRRFHIDYGHGRSLKNQWLREQEELAAAVLGMMLQLRAGDQPDLDITAYLWNAEPPYYLWQNRQRYEERDRAYRERHGLESRTYQEHVGDGFWLGAQRLRKMGWLCAGFKINERKLSKLFTE